MSPPTTSSPRDDSKEKKEQEHRRRSALSAIRQFRPEILRNRFEIEGKSYPIFTAQDLVEKENQYQCSYCYLHSTHTPCGNQLGKYKECLSEKQGDVSPSEALSSRKEDDPCKSVFEKEFFPCFVKLSGSPYLYLRANALFGLETRDLFKVWFDIQKHQALPTHH